MNDGNRERTHEGEYEQMKEWKKSGAHKEGANGQLTHKEGWKDWKANTIKKRG